MEGFGVWLCKTRDRRPEVQQLRTAAFELGPDWPLESTDQTDYENSITNAKQEPEAANLIQALRSLWPTYQAENPRTKKSEGWANLGSRLLDYASNIGAWGVALGGLLLIVLLFKSFNPTFLDKMAEIEAARGLITFLFAVATVGVAVIVVLAVLLSNAANEELSERFQRGKDVLTILIGVFGAILGFYFGSEARESVDQQVAVLRQELTELRQTAGRGLQRPPGAQSATPATPEASQGEEDEPSAPEGPAGQ